MSSSIFAAVEMAPRDPILGLNESFNADARTTKVNLGVGVYLGDDGKVVQRNVTVAETVEKAWRVTAGLSAGDRVIVEGSGKVRPGQTVNAVAVDPNAKAAGKPTAVPVTPATPASKSPASAG